MIVPDDGQIFFVPLADITSGPTPTPMHDIAAFYNTHRMSVDSRNGWLYYIEQGVTGIHMGEAWIEEEYLGRAKLFHSDQSYVQHWPSGGSDMGHTALALDWEDQV